MESNGIFGADLERAQLTGKNPCGMGPPGIPSPGAICPSGLGTGPAFCIKQGTGFISQNKQKNKIDARNKTKT